ncbi:unnamed protein product [Auanema sp. JU1783]|nr:unnamed protein product [Auanema sp. JU1783]
MDETAAIAQPYIQQYEAFYREINPGGSPCIGSADAAGFLRRSNLNHAILGRIWEISDYQKRGYLDKRGFYMALKLIAAAQQGHPVQPQSVYLTGLAPPTMVPSQASPAMSSSNSPSTAPASYNWAINTQDQAKYDAIFDSLTPVDGKLPGVKVRPVLLNSGLNPASLAKIWELADQDKDGQLDRVEMSVALHLVYRALQNEPVPGALPSNLIHPSKAHISRRSSLASQGDFYPSTNLAGINARSRAGSMASLDGIAMSTPSIPQQERSMSAQPMSMRNGSATATPVHGAPPVPPPPSAASISAAHWPVNPHVFAAQFAACDSDSDGLVNGMDVRQILMASGLPQQLLAKIWELVDIQRNGTLKLEQFALAMYLINKAKQGEDLPAALPEQLVPPSFRAVNPPETPEEHIPPSVSNMSLGTAAQSDNPEVRQLAEDMEGLLKEKRDAEEAVAQLEADMIVKNSVIKNLQIELQTLESTVKQLDRQKGEAGRRLADLDDQIKQLESAGAAQSAKGAETATRLEQLKIDAVEGVESTERDQAAIQKTKGELQQLELEGRELSSHISADQQVREQIVDDFTKIEREFDRSNTQVEALKQEIEKVTGLTSELESVLNDPEATEKMRTKIHLLSAVERQDLFNDNSPIASTSTSSAFAQPPDPFAGHQSGMANVDPFSQDPFASAPGNNSFGTFGNDPFSSQNGAPNQNNAAKSVPPPRPAPPKSRQTPVNDDPFSNVDPFAGQTNQSNVGGFADFANFGAFN